VVHNFIQFGYFNSAPYLGARNLNFGTKYLNFGTNILNFGKISKSGLFR